MRWIVINKSALNQKKTLSKYLIELDMVIGYTSKNDRLSETANSLFDKISNKVVTNFNLAASALLEYSLYLKSKNVSLVEIKDTLVAWSEFPNLKISDFDHEILIKTFQLQHDYQLSFFDSLHAATAIHNSMILVGTDTIYPTIKGLDFLNVAELI